jgi:DNA-binding beta-propeller fold protein YncE
MSAARAWGRRWSARAALACAVAGCGDAAMTTMPPPPPPCEQAPGVICTVAGTGIAGDGADDRPALDTRLYLPQDVSIAPDGRLYIVDWNNHRIRARQDDGTLHIVAGIGELGPSSDDPSTGRLNHPTQVTFDGVGHLVIAAWHNSRIKTLDAATGELLDVCGNGKRGFAGDGGPAATATLDLPVAVVFDPAGNMLIADQANDRIRKVDAATQTISTFAGVGPCTDPTACPPLGDGGPATGAFISLPQGQSARPAGRIDVDAGGSVYVADTLNNRVRKIDPTGVITTIAGTGTIGATGDGGPATEATLSGLADVAVGPDGVYVADTGNGCVRVIRNDGTIATAAGTCGAPGFAGDGGPAIGAKLDRPGGIALDGAGNLFIADTYNQRIRVVYR